MPQMQDVRAMQSEGRIRTTKDMGRGLGLASLTPGGDHKCMAILVSRQGPMEEGECNTDSSLGCMSRRCRGRCVCLCYGLRHAPLVDNLQNPRVTWINKGWEEQQIDGGDQQ